MIGAIRQTVTSTLGELRRSGVLTLRERRWHVAQRVMGTLAQPISDSKKTDHPEII